LPRDNRAKREVRNEGEEEQKDPIRSPEHRKEKGAAGGGEKKSKGQHGNSVVFMKSWTYVYANRKVQVMKKGAKKRATESPGKKEEKEKKMIPAFPVPDVDKQVRLRRNHKTERRKKKKKFQGGLGK